MKRLKEIIECSKKTEWKENSGKLNRYIDLLESENKILKGDTDILKMDVKILEQKLTKLRDTDWIERVYEQSNYRGTENIDMVYRCAYDLIQEELK